MPTAKILKLCRQCTELLGGFDYQVARKEEKGICEMCKKKCTVRAVRINGKKTYD